MTASSDASQALQRVQTRLSQACGAAGRLPADVRLLAVSKIQPIDKIRALYAAGQRAFGENYPQEASEKALALAALGDIEWHLIGPLQSNKTRDIAARMHWIHSVDRIKIAERLSAQRPAHLPPLNVCVQINISNELTKSGVDPVNAQALIDAVATLPNVVLRGVMGMPEPGIGEQKTREQFERLASIFHAQRARHATMDTLSMGMSDDLEMAVACGSTMVRVGTALFGARPPKPDATSVSGLPASSKEI
jgi:PLP dependent protein